MSKKIMLTITGPSLAGKSTLENKLKERGFVSGISTTTRKPRSGEKHGVHYYFVSHEQFEKMLMNKEFAENISYNGDLYGMTCQELERVTLTNKPVVIVAEPVGKNQLWTWCALNNWNFISVFLNGQPEDIAARFVYRFIEEPSYLNDNVIDFNISKEIARKRLACILGIERQWIRDCETNRHIYSLVFNRFDKDNEQEVIDSILSELNQYDKSN